MSSAVGHKRSLKEGLKEGSGRPISENRGAFLGNSVINAGIHHNSRKSSHTAASLSHQRPILREITSSFTHGQSVALKSRNPMPNQTSGPRTSTGGAPLYPTTGRKMPSSLVCLPRANPGYNILRRPEGSKHKFEVQVTHAPPQGCSSGEEPSAPQHHHRSPQLHGMNCAAAPPPLSSVLYPPELASDAAAPPQRARASELDQHFLRLSSDQPDCWDPTQVAASHVQDGHAAQASRAPPPAGRAQVEVDELSLAEVESLMARLQLRRQRILESGGDKAGMQPMNAVAPTAMNVDPASHPAAQPGAPPLMLPRPRSSSSSSLSSEEELGELMHNCGSAQEDDDEDQYDRRMKQYLGQRYPELFLPHKHGGAPAAPEEVPATTAAVAAAARATLDPADPADMVVAEEGDEIGRMLDVHGVLQGFNTSGTGMGPNGRMSATSLTGTSLSTSIGVEEQSFGGGGAGAGSARSCSSPSETGRSRWQGGGARAPDDKMFSSRYPGMGPAAEDDDDDEMDGDMHSGVYPDELMSPPSELGDASAFKQGLESATEESSVGMQSSCSSPVSLPEGDSWSRKCECSMGSTSPRSRYLSFRPQKHRHHHPRKPQALKSPHHGSMCEELLSPNRSRSVVAASLHSPRSAFSPRTPRSTTSSL